MGIKPHLLEADKVGSTFCEQCKKECHSEDELDVHHATACKNPPARKNRRFSCRMCDEPRPRFFTRFLLADHINERHLAKKGKKKEELKDGSTGEAQEQEVSQQSSSTKRKQKKQEKRKNR